MGKILDIGGGKLQKSRAQRSIRSTELKNWRKSTRLERDRSKSSRQREIQRFTRFDLREEILFRTLDLFAVFLVV